jgi:ZIP family zinc transporter
MYVIFMSILAGVIGTGFGGVLTAAFGIRSDRMISMFMSFAGGVIASLVLFELIPDAAESLSRNFVFVGVVSGAALLFVLNYLIGNAMGSGENNMLRFGALIFLAISLHNVTDGFVIGVAGFQNIALGFTIAVMIGVHNIPVGIAVSAPLIAGGMSKRKAVLVTLLTGVPTVIGATTGILAVNISDFALALSFSIAGGAMLYAVLGEILPQSVKMSKNRFPVVVLLLGLIAGYLLTQI